MHVQLKKKTFVLPNADMFVSFNGKWPFIYFLLIFEII